MSDDDEEDDEFWQVAMLEVPKFHVQPDNDDDDDSYDMNERTQDGRPKTVYRLPWNYHRPISTTTTTNKVDDEAEPTPSCIKLYLSQLPDEDGVWSPLGAHAWYASSLLVAYLIHKTGLVAPEQDDDPKDFSILRLHLVVWANRHVDDESCFTALELGSGAVGLAGISLGLIVGEFLRRHAAILEAESDSSAKEDALTIETSSDCRAAMSRLAVILTDNERPVLKQLQQNVEYNWERLKLHHDNHHSFSPRFSVQSLDWNQGEEFLTGDIGLDLVVGSELVYTLETARACANIVLKLLKKHPKVLVLILQVSDRDGWNNFFLPELRRHQNLKVVEETLEDADLHAMASSMIPQGGTLDRFAYGACYVKSLST